ncbi:GNAT family N-acetyltransferase [Streptomyces sp. NPDC006632]|uniref:GNAT family N-acetyltransferase n=1 Tax=Streptomyces sp. NPDC006632 TaxID=3157182 RepID=UPI0033B71499
MGGPRGSGGGAGAPGRIRVVRPGDLSAGDLRIWRALRAASRAPENPFMEPEFTLAVGRVRSSARVAVVRGEEEGSAPVAFFPYQKGRLGQGRAIGFGVSDCQGLVAAPEPALDRVELLRACGVSSWEFDNLEAGQSLFVPDASAAYTSFVIDVGAGYEAYEATLRRRSPKFFKTTTAKERRLGRRAGEVRFVFDERDPAMLARLMEWKSAQYRRTGRRDRFAREWIGALVRQLAHTRAPGCSGVLSVLYAGDEPVAAHFGLRSRTMLACWFPAYDPEFATYSPGLVLHLRMAEAAAAAGIGTLDLGRGAAEYKDALKTGGIPVYEGAATRFGAGAALHWIGREPSRRAHGFVRSRPRLAEVARRGLRQAGRMRGGAGQ